MDSRCASYHFIKRPLLADELVTLVKHSLQSKFQRKNLIQSSFICLFVCDNSLAPVRLITREKLFLLASGWFFYSFHQLLTEYTTLCVCVFDKLTNLSLLDHHAYDYGHDDELRSGCYIIKVVHWVAANEHLDSGEDDNFVLLPELSKLLCLHAPTETSVVWQQVRVSRLVLSAYPNYRLW